MAAPSASSAACRGGRRAPHMAALPVSSAAFHGDGRAAPMAALPASSAAGHGERWAASRATLPVSSSYSCAPRRRRLAPSGGHGGGEALYHRARQVEHEASDEPHTDGGGTSFGTAVHVVGGGATFGVAVVFFKCCSYMILMLQ
ncbi:unnamed protein product [Urochloa humidicola]